MTKSLCLVFRSAKEAILCLGFFTSFFHQATSDGYVDGTKGLERPKSGNGVAFANFATHKFHHLNITPLVSASVKNIRECGKLCVDHPSCFSANFAAFFHEEGKIFCELLPSDKYDNSETFLDSQVFHHLSIKVSLNNFIGSYFSIISESCSVEYITFFFNFLYFFPIYL